VDSAEVPQYTVEPEVNPDPLTVMVKSALPAPMNAGDRVVMAGVGLGAFTANETALEVELPNVADPP